MTHKRNHFPIQGLQMPISLPFCKHMALYVCLFFAAVILHTSDAVAEKRKEQCDAVRRMAEIELDGRLYLIL
jgi:hypothetical protein